MTEERNKTVSHIETGQKCLNKMAENVGETALNSVIEFVRKKYGEACIDTGKAFELYLKNSEIRYNQVKTLADLSEPKELEGPNGIYVDVFVRYKKKKIPVKQVDSLMELSNNIVIIGSGGTGKSMMMRHLFVDTQRRGSYIPVLVEMRKIDSVNDKNALLNLIHDCIESFDVRLNHEQLEYSLRTGKFLFLFDGLDEVKEEFRGAASQLVQELSNKYPNNGYIVSSREEGVSFSELATYTIMNACSLEKYQAVELVKKIGRGNDKIDEFAELLENELYDAHMDFASNPLLLTMMYITFIDNNMIPEHLIDFYESAYDALYKRHDANKEGLFKRQYKCKKLGEREFKNLFSYFCFQTYFEQQYEFSRTDIVQYIQRGIEKLKLTESLENAEMFFDDIKDIVCLIVDEGNKYKFTHRSFQSYFAAYYTSTQVSDEQQKMFLKKELEKGYRSHSDYIDMLYQIEGERFNSNVIEPSLAHVLKIVDEDEYPEYALLQMSCQAIAIHDNNIVRYINTAAHFDVPYERNVYMLFEDMFYIKHYDWDERLQTKIIELLKNDCEISENSTVEATDLIKLTPEDAAKEIVDLLIEFFKISDVLQQMRQWMEGQLAKKKQISDIGDDDKMFLLL